MKEPKTIKFEEALQELETIAEQIERTDMNLEDSIKAFERGLELKKICEERLKEAEGKVELLKKKEDGSYSKEQVLQFSRAKKTDGD